MREWRHSGFASSITNELTQYIVSVAACVMSGAASSSDMSNNYHQIYHRILINIYYHERAMKNEVEGGKENYFTAMDTA